MATTPRLNRRQFMGAIGAGALAISASAQNANTRKPNFVIIFADDLGYGDLGCYGHPTIRTPNLDAMADDGVRMTSFYAAAPVCSPSRAALLTGRHAVRCGMPGNTGPDSDNYLPESELTMGDIFGAQGYRTACVGKWHLGHQRPELLPTGRGFDSWYGLPYSNDMIKPWVQTDKPLHLYRDTTPIEEPVDQNTLTERYTDEAVKFIKDAGDESFLLYFAHSMPHLPLRASDRFRGQSRSGLYGDVIEMMDWSTGQIREALREAGVEDNTLIVFTSDNGPWLDLPDRMLQDGNTRWHGGSPGPLRGAKGTTYEGGLRVPMIACWPGTIPAGTRCDELASTLDLLPTFANAADVPLPDDRTFDGTNITPLLKDEGPSPNEYFYYFRGANLQAVRDQTWKYRQETPDSEEELFHLNRDPGELYNVIKDEPAIAASLRDRMQQFREAVTEI
jgi:arylsulfatase A